MRRGPTDRARRALLATAIVWLPSGACAGLAAFLLGSLLGLRGWSPAWPTLSALSALRAGAVAWLLAVVAVVALGPLLPRVLRVRLLFPPARRRGRRAVLISMGLLPAALWLLRAVPLDATRRVSALGRVPGDGRPNLVLITLDAMRRDHLGVYGDSRGLTPHLDAFAKDATQYDSAYAASSWTLASLGALATGLPPSQSGLMYLNLNGRGEAPSYTQLPEDKTLLSEQLRRAGYATAADVTNVFLERELGWPRGFDDFRNEGGVDGDRSGLAIAPTLTDHSAAWLRLNWRQPFFLWVHYLDPHCPYDSPDTPKELRARYPATWVARRDDWRDRAPRLSPAEQAQYRRFCRDLYAEEVRYVDRWAGQLLAQLKAAGLYDNSLIVITADHGEELFDHGGLDHGHSLHEEVLSVPLLVKWPAGVMADRRVTQVVPLLAVTSTFLRAAQAPPLSSQSCALPTRDGGPDAEVYSEWLLYGPPQTSLTTGDYRVVYHPRNPAGTRFEVYDRRTDRREFHDLSSTGAARDLCRHLKTLTETAVRQARETGRAFGSPLRPSEEVKRRLHALGYLGK